MVVSRNWCAASEIDFTVMELYHWQCPFRRVSSCYWRIPLLRICTASIDEQMFSGYPELLLHSSTNIAIGQIALLLQLTAPPFRKISWNQSKEYWQHEEYLHRGPARSIAGPYIKF